jgi:hypothetical protein
MKTVILCIMTFLGVLEAGPKVVAKFGPPECPWSEQLKREVWDSSLFQALLEGAGIAREEQGATQKDQDVPVLELLTDRGEVVGSLGYLLIAPEKYVDLLKEMLSIHSLCQALASINAEQLLELYRKTQVLNMTACAEKLFQEGLAKDTGVGFLIEHYAKTVKEHPHRAHKIKQEIRLRKPDDQAVEWELALLSFQARRETLQEVSKIALPLEKFLRNYGSQTRDYAWRCHLVLAEFYQDRNMPDKAQHHAERASSEAPAELKDLMREFQSKEKK